MTGLFPTQSQFWDWIDSFFHKDDLIEISNVNGLAKALQGKADVGTTGGGSGGLSNIILNAGVNTWDAPAGTLLEKILVNDPAFVSIKIGTALGGEDIMPEKRLSQHAAVLTIDYPVLVDQTIYFGGYTSDTITTIYRR